MCIDDTGWTDDNMCKYLNCNEPTHVLTGGASGPNI